MPTKIVNNKRVPERKDNMKFSKISLDGAKSDYGRETDWNKRYYKVTRYKVNNCARECYDSWDSQKSIQGIEAAMKNAKQWGTLIQEYTGDYCKSLAETVEEEKPSNQDEEEKPVDIPPPSNGDDEGTVATGTDWCSIKAKSPARIKEIEGEIAEERIKIKADYVAAVNKVKDLNKKTLAKMEKEGAGELKSVKERYAESKKKCSAKEEVQKKLKDTEIGEGFWEKLLAYLNA